MPFPRKASVELERLVCEFNLRPDSYMAPSWLPEHWPDRHRQQIAFRPHARRMLAQYMLATLKLDDQHDFDFSSQEKRIALIAPDALGRIADYCGLCAHKVLLREQRFRHVREASARHFGKDVLQFVMDRAPDMAARFKSLAPEPDIATGKIRARGHRLLLGVLESYGPAVYGRARLKLPRDLAQQGPQGLDTTMRQHLAELIILSVIPERVSEWDWLF